MFPVGAANGVNVMRRMLGGPFPKATIQVIYFFRVVARKLTVRFQASAASAARWRPLLLGIFEPVSGIGIDFDVDTFLVPAFCKETS
jgi:hypothetical protein